MYDELSCRIRVGELYLEMSSELNVSIVDETIQRRLNLSIFVRGTGKFAKYAFDHLCYPRGVGTTCIDICIRICIFLQRRRRKPMNHAGCNVRCARFQEIINRYRIVPSVR